MPSNRKTRSDAVPIKPISEQFNAVLASMYPRYAMVWFYIAGMAGQLLHRRFKKRNAGNKERATAHAYNQAHRDKRLHYYNERYRNDPLYRQNRRVSSAMDFQTHKEKRVKRHKEWLERNRERNREWHRQHVNHIRATDPYYNIRNRLTSRVWSAVARCRGSKAAKTEELVGCTVDELRRHIESQFTDGMTWDKFLNGMIHIDHIKPCSMFDLSDPEQQRKCFHYTNLQPLWAKDNLSKGDRFCTLQP